MSRRFLLFLAGIAVLSACASSPGNPACGITALAGATILLDQFKVPNQTLSTAPRQAPDLVPVRVAAGPVFRGFVRILADSSWVVRLEGSLPVGGGPGFGVLVVGRDGTPRGVMLYTGPPVSGAPIIGSVTLGSRTLPLVGLQTDIGGLEDKACPFFPDSVARP